MWKANPREIFQGKPTQSGGDWKPNNSLCINMPALYQLSYIKPLFWRSPYLVNILSSDVRNIPTIAEIKVDNP